MNIVQPHAEMAQQPEYRRSAYEHELNTLLAGDQLGMLALREVLPYPERAQEQSSHQQSGEQSVEAPVSVDVVSLRQLEEIAMVDKNTAGEAARRAVEDSSANPEDLADRVELLGVYYALKRTYDPTTSIIAARELTHAAEALHIESRISCPGSDEQGSH